MPLDSPSEQKAIETPKEPEPVPSQQNETSAPPEMPVLDAPSHTAPAATATANGGAEPFAAAKHAPLKTKEEVCIKAHSTQYVFISEIFRYFELSLWFNS